MPETSYVVPLGDEGTDRYRLDCTAVKGVVTIFRIQYEAYIAGKWLALVRYDTAHGFPHRDLMHPDRPEEKTDYPDFTNAEILTRGQNDIKNNWKKYRTRYEREMQK